MTDGKVTIELPQLAEITATLSDLRDAAARNVAAGYQILDKLDAILRREHRSALREGEIMATLDDVKNKVEANGDVVDSAVTLLSELKTKLDQAIADDDPAALQALSDEIGAQTQALAGAVASNTPAAPQP